MSDALECLGGPFDGEWIAQPATDGDAFPVIGTAAPLVSADASTPLAAFVGQIGLYVRTTKGPRVVWLWQESTR